MGAAHQSGLTIVASYLYPYEADLAKALLDSHDIESWVLDEHQIRQRWWLAGALGGVKVGVAEDDFERARQIVAVDHSSALESIPECELPPHADEICPDCGAPSARLLEADTRVSARTLLAVAASIFFSSPIPLRTVQEDWACGACGARWKRDRPR